MQAMLRDVPAATGWSDLCSCCLTVPQRYRSDFQQRLHKSFLSFGSICCALISVILACQQTRRWRHCTHFHCMARPLAALCYPITTSCVSCLMAVGRHAVACLSPSLTGSPSGSAVCMQLRMMSLCMLRLPSAWRPWFRLCCLLRCSPPMPHCSNWFEVEQLPLAR